LGTTSRLTAHRIRPGKRLSGRQRLGILAAQATTKEEQMHARVSTYRGEGDRLAEGFEGVTGALTAVDGFSHAYFMVDRESGKGISITFWDSEDALHASAAKADELRKQGAEASGSQIETVQHYEVRLTVGTPR
jgi:heme-degrading monooxygenase HmoA